MTTQIKDPDLMNYLMNDEEIKLIIRGAMDGADNPVDVFKKFSKNPKLMTNMFFKIKKYRRVRIEIDGGGYRLD